MTYKQEAFAALAKGLIKKLEMRGMNGYYFDNSTSLLTFLKKELPAECSITCGGSESLKESGVMELIQNGSYKYLDRSLAKTPEEKRLFFSQAVLADIFFMSSNAITLDGELINIDGNGNRVACLAQGPAHVYIIIGSNKIVSTIEEGIDRVHNIAAPANAKRLHTDTPCFANGRCSNCLSPDSMCSHTVITRRSGHPGRIKIFLVNEELGF